VIWLRIKAAEHVVMGVAYRPRDWVLQPVIGWIVCWLLAQWPSNRRTAPTLDIVDCYTAYRQSCVICKWMIVSYYIYLC